jgi:alpha-D-xyloside xylohydrolase
VGGYFGTPEPTVYIRWLQFGMLSPLVRFHGTSAREPWAFGEEAVRQYQKYAALRYSLMEYLYSEAIQCAKDCTPMLRALALDFPEDPAAGEIDDEYLLGRNLLVAPVFSTDASRAVYLPAGTAWLDYHTSAWYDGGQTIKADTPIDITPVFLRGGTATPFIEPMQYVDERPIERIRWEICPVHGIALYDLTTDRLDIRVRYDFQGETGVGRITAEGAPVGVRMEYRIHCPDVKRLYCNGREIPFAYGDNRFVLARAEA